MQPCNTSKEPLLQTDKPSRSESAIQSNILNHLRHLPECWAAKYPATFMRGIPDIIGVFHGTFFALEVKRPGEKPTPIQKAVIEQINAAKMAFMQAMMMQMQQAQMALQQTQQK